MAHITVAWFHSRQADLAAHLLTDLYAEGRLGVGQGGRHEAEELTAAGLALRSFREEVAPTFDTPVAARFTSGVRVAAEQDELVPDSGWPGMYVMSLAGPLFRAWRSSLDGFGIVAVENLGEDIFSVRGPTDVLEGLRQVPFVLGARPYTSQDTWYRAPRVPAQLDVVEPAMLCDLELHRGASPWALIDMLASLGVTVVGQPGPSVRVLLARTSDAVARIAAHPDVALIHEARTATPANDRARRLVGLPATPPSAVGALDGSGEIVAVADSGVDAAHPALAGRVTAVDLGGRSGDTSDPTGHGTHVAATAVGAGSNPGLAPAAQLYAQSLTDSRGDLGGANDLRTLLDDAYTAGARVHNNSWTYQVGDGVYDSGARTIDEVVRLRRDLVVVIAAGNEGRQAGGPPTPGELAYVTVAAPATAKNALCVGASRSDRTGVTTTRSQTWRSWFPRFSADPVGRDALSGDPSCLDARSGRGNCKGLDRVKPDLVAPGTFIRSARASTAPAGQFWADDPADRHQAYLGGTSMAAAVVSGSAVLVRQHLRGRGHDPSAALVRAVLLNGAEWLTGWDALQNHAAAPNYHQGFGRVNLTISLPDGVGRVSLDVLDEWWSPGARRLQRMGEQVVVTLDIGAAADLRVCLVWDDPPGRAAQNILLLRVENDETRDAWLGNSHAPGHHRVPGSVDDSNTVQVVRLIRPDPGTYRISVTAASDILDGPQAFALAITGELLSTLQVTGP